MQCIKFFFLLINVRVRANINLFIIQIGQKRDNNCRRLEGHPLQVSHKQDWSQEL